MTSPDHTFEKLPIIPSNHNNSHCFLLSADVTVMHTEVKCFCCRQYHKDRQLTRDSAFVLRSAPTPELSSSSMHIVYKATLWNVHVLTGFQGQKKPTMCN